MPWNSLFVLVGSKFRLRIPFGKPHTARDAGSHLWLTFAERMCWPFVSQALPRSSKEKRLNFLKPSWNLFHTKDFSLFYFLRKISLPEILFFSAILWFFLQKKYNFIFCRLFYLYFRLVIFIVFIIKIWFFIKNRIDYILYIILYFSLICFVVYCMWM